MPLFTVPKAKRDTREEQPSRNSRKEAQNPADNRLYRVVSGWCRERHAKIPSISQAIALRRNVGFWRAQLPDLDFSDFEPFVFIAMGDVLSVYCFDHAL